MKKGEVVDGDHPGPAAAEARGGNEIRAVEHVDTGGGQLDAERPALPAKVTGRSQHVLGQSAKPGSGLGVLAAAVDNQGVAVWRIREAGCQRPNQLANVSSDPGPLVR